MRCRLGSAARCWAGRMAAISPALFVFMQTQPHTGTRCDCMWLMMVAHSTSRGSVEWCTSRRAGSSHTAGNWGGGKRGG